MAHLRLKCPKCGNIIEIEETGEKAQRVVCDKCGGMFILKDKPKEEYEKREEPFKRDSREKEKKARVFDNLGDPNNPINIFEKDNKVKISSETKFCSNCGAKIDAKAEICPKCGVRVAPAKIEVPQGGSRTLLYIISFLFGIVGIVIGAIYLMKPSKAAQDFGKDCLMLALIPMVLGILFYIFVLWAIHL